MKQKKKKPQKRTKQDLFSLCVTAHKVFARAETQSKFPVYHRGKGKVQGRLR